MVWRNNPKILSRSGYFGTYNLEAGTCFGGYLQNSDELWFFSSATYIKLNCKINCFYFANEFIDYAFVLSKAKLFGVHTWMYGISNINEAKLGCEYKFIWERDS